MKRTKEQREKEFAKIFTSKMYAGTTLPLDDRMNSVGRLLTELFTRVHELEDRLENLREV
jgi:hypothetical protein